MLDSTSRGMPACRHTCSSVHPSRPAAQRTTLRAAWASKLNVSSTRPAPSSGLESIATRRVLGSLRGSNALVRLRQLDGAFEHAAIQVGGDQPLAKLLQRALRKRRRLGTQAPQHHLHPQIDDGQLDHLGVGHAQISLHQHRHGHHRGRTRLFPGARRAVHRRPTRLETRRRTTRADAAAETRGASGPDRDASAGTALASSARQAVSNARSSSACLLGPTAHERIRSQIA